MNELTIFVMANWVWFAIGAAILVFWKLEDGTPLYQAILKKMQQQKPAPKPEPIYGEPAAPVMPQPVAQPEPVVVKAGDNRAMGITIIGEPPKKLHIENLDEGK